MGLINSNNNLSSSNNKRIVLLGIVFFLFVILEVFHKQEKANTTVSIQTLLKGEKDVPLLNNQDESSLLVGSPAFTSLDGELE